MELHILTFIEQCSGLQGRRRCLAAGVLDIWHGTDPQDLGTARHGTSLGDAASMPDKFQRAHALYIPNHGDVFCHKHPKMRLKLD